MSKYVCLPQTDRELPLVGKELIYADLGTIVYRSLDQSILTQSFSPLDTKRLLFHTRVDSEGVYPRYDPSDYFYKVTPDTEVSTIVIPDQTQNIDFESLTDQRSLELKAKLETHDRVYVFWSGGIDSTFILSAILKNWHSADLEKLTVVCNHYSKEENPVFYEKFIKDKIATVESDLFYSDKLKFNKDNIYVAADTADVIIGYSDIGKFEKMFPGIYNNSYKKHSKEIIEYFGNDDVAYYTYQRIVKSLIKNKVEVESIFDFFWWIDFNWSFDQNIYFFLYTYSLLPEDLHPRDFMTKNLFDWCKDPRYQYWAFSSIGTSLRIKDDIKSYKYIFKKYIYDFDKNYDYFINKTREGSTTKNNSIRHGNKVVAIDKDWTLYYRTAPVVQR